MKIEIVNSLVEFTPESDAEAKALSVLWTTVVDCVQFNKKLVPVGEYQPPKSEIARFAIEE